MKTNQVITIKCDNCNYELKNSITKGDYCPNMQCKNNPYYGKSI